MMLHALHQAPVAADDTHNDANGNKHANDAGDTAHSSESDSNKHAKGATSDDTLDATGLATPYDAHDDVNVKGSKHDTHQGSKPSCHLL